MKKRSVLILLVLVLSVTCLTACGKKEEAAKDDNKLVVGLECGYAPFNWTQLDDSNGGVAISGDKEYAGGYDVEMAKKVAEGLGKELEIVKTEWAGLTPALMSGKIDVIMAGMSPDEERRKSIDFSDAYYTSDLVMIVKRDGKYDKASSLEDFKGAKITGQLSTLHYKVIDQIPGVEKETAMEDFPAMRVALESGMIDGYVAERPEGLSTEAFNDNFKMVEFQEGKGFEASKDEVSIAVGVAKDSELTEKINKILSEISEEDRHKIMENAVLNQPAGK